MRDLQTFTAELSVGLTLVLSQSNWRIARKKDRLELDAQENPREDPEEQSFALNFYPLLAAAVVSDNCPSIEDCMDKLHENDLELWYQTAKEANPSWFVFMDALSKLLQDRESADMETKKELNSNSTEEELTQTE